MELTSTTSQNSSVVPPPLSIFPGFPHIEPYYDSEGNLTPVGQLLTTIMNQLWTKIQAEKAELDHAVLKHGIMGFNLGLASILVLNIDLLSPQQMQTTAVAELLKSEGAAMSDLSDIKGILSDLETNSTDVNNTTDSNGNNASNGISNLTPDQLNKMSIQLQQDYQNLYQSNPNNPEVNGVHLSDEQMYQATSALSSFNWNWKEGDAGSAWKYTSTGDTFKSSCDQLKADLDTGFNVDDPKNYNNNAGKFYANGLNTPFNLGYDLSHNNQTNGNIQIDMQAMAYNYALDGDTANNQTGTNTQSSSSIEQFKGDTSNAQQMSTVAQQQNNTEIQEAATEIQSGTSTGQQIVSDSSSEVSNTINHYNTN